MLGEKASEEELDEMMRIASAGGKGSHFSFEEFVLVYNMMDNDNKGSKI